MRELFYVDPTLSHMMYWLHSAFIQLCISEDILTYTFFYEIKFDIGHLNINLNQLYISYPGCFEYILEFTFTVLNIPNVHVAATRCRHSSKFIRSTENTDISHICLFKHYYQFR